MAQQAWPPGGPTTIRNVIRSYLYTQYQDDDDLQAFAGAYNAYAQAYLDYLNGLNLPIYTANTIIGPLLDWSALGIYGFKRPVFSNPGTGILGPLNTYQLNYLTLNTYQPGLPATFTLATDDVFKRTLTWHLYKGDGRVFSIRWLKRRVARFIYGLNGTDPALDPYLISVTLTGPYAATITVPGIYMSTIFAQGVDQGVLEMPFQFAWTVALSTPTPADTLLDGAGFVLTDDTGDPLLGS